MGVRREESGGAVGISTQFFFFFFLLSSQTEGEVAPDCPLGLMLSWGLLSWDLREKMEFSVTARSSYLGR